MIARFLFFTAVICVFAINSCYADKTIDEKVDAVLTLTDNLGAITNRAVVDCLTTGKKTINIKAAHGGVQVEFDKNGELVSVSRQSDKPNEPLKWKKEEASKKATVYISNLVNLQGVGEPLLITQENINGLRDLWSVGWTRRIKGYSVRDDFIAMTFNEHDGLFGFARSWSTPEPSSMPEKPLGKSEAIKLAQPAAAQVMQKFVNRFAGYRLGNLLLADLMIVAPNNVLTNTVKTEADLLKGDTKNPRLVWVIGFKLEVDRMRRESTISEANGLAVWIDAETGACIGAEF